MSLSEQQEWEDWNRDQSVFVALARLGGTASPDVIYDELVRIYDETGTPLPHSRSGVRVVLLTSPLFDRLDSGLFTRRAF